MNSLFIMRTASTPEVAFEPSTGTLTLVGECFPENPHGLFSQLHPALDHHLLAGGSSAGLDVVFRLTYVNSSSTKALRRLLVMLDDHAAAGKDVRVTWTHDVEDETMVELGEDLLHELRHLEASLVALDVKTTGQQPQNAPSALNP